MLTCPYQQEWQCHNNNGFYIGLLQPGLKGSLVFLLWSKDGAVDVQMGQHDVYQALYRKVFVLLELLLGLYRSLQSPGTLQEELRSYRFIRFGREFKLSRSLVARLGSMNRITQLQNHQIGRKFKLSRLLVARPCSTEPQSPTEGRGSVGGSRAVETACAVGPCTQGHVGPYHCFSQSVSAFICYTLSLA